MKTVAAPLPNPGPIRASERAAILRARRPHLATARMAKVRAELVKKHGREFWEQRLHTLRCRQSLSYFVKTLWHVIEPGTPLVWNWHLDVICDALEKVTNGDPEYRQLMINVPPGHTKSRIVSVMWPAWEWLENPGIRSLFVTYVQKLSNRDSLYTRDLITSDEYQRLIPRVYGATWDQPWALKDDANNVESYSTTLFGNRVATSVTGAGTGFRGNKVGVDDPLNVDEFPSAESLESVNSWYDKRMSMRLNDMMNDAFVVIMQRQHDNDLCGHILAQDRANAGNPFWRPFKHICLPSEYDPDRRNEFDRRTERGELLFPAKFPRAVIEQAKIKLGSMYAAQHDQDPTPAHGAIFPMARLRFWFPRGHPPPTPHREKDEHGNEVSCWQAELPTTRFDVQIQSWDCAFKDHDTSDYVAGGLLARLGSAIYLIDGVHGHFGFWRTIEEIRKMSANYPLATTKVIEDKANGTAIIETLHAELFGIVAEEPVGSKAARAWATEPYIKAGNVWLPHPDLYPWVHDLLNEMRRFPLGHHDDWVDMLTQGIRNIVLEGGALLDAMTR